MYIYDVDLKV